MIPVVPAEFASVWDGRAWRVFRRNATLEVVTWTTRWSSGAQMICQKDSADANTGQMLSFYFFVTKKINGVAEPEISYSIISAFTYAGSSFTALTVTGLSKLSSASFDARATAFANWAISQVGAPVETPITGSPRVAYTSDSEINCAVVTRVTKITGNYIVFKDYKGSYGSISGSALSGSLALYLKADPFNAGTTSSSGKVISKPSTFPLQYQIPGGQTVNLYPSDVLFPDGIYSYTINDQVNIDTSSAVTYYVVANMGHSKTGTIYGALWKSSTSIDHVKAMYEDSLFKSMSSTQIQVLNITSATIPKGFNGTFNIGNIYTGWAGKY